MKLEWWKDRS